MRANLVAIVLAWSGVGLAFVLAPALDRSERVRLAIVWATTAAVLFVVQDFLLVLVASFLLYVAASPKSAADRLGFFLIAVPCLPVYVIAPIGFPGVNSLFEATAYKITVAAILVPLFIAQSAERARTMTISPPEICLVLYALLTASIITSVMNFTTGIRFLVDQLLIVILPYVVLRRYVTSQDDLDTCLKAFVAVSLVLAGVAMMATVRQWDFYRFLEPPSVMTIPEWRSGFLRIGATANTHSLGYHLAAALLISEYLKHRLNIRFQHMMLIRALLAGGMIISSSRGAVAGLLVGGAFMLALRSRRPAIWLGLGAAATMLAGVWLLTADTTTVDEHGTFVYRQELLKTSLGHIQDHWLLGDYLFRSNQKFAHLLQGQSIIDVTNLYLQIALYYGAPALALFLAPAAAAIFPSVNTTVIEAARMKSATPKGRSCVSALSRSVPPVATVDSVPRVTGPVELAIARAALTGTVVGWLVLVATTSDVGLTLHIGLVLCALCSAVAHVRPVAANVPQASPLPHRVRLPAPA
jgi:hypothetical protein